MAGNIGIDLGTTSIIIHVEGKGVVLSEPSVAAVDNHTGDVLAVGDEAFKMVGRTPAHITAVYPLKDGVISNYTLTKELIRSFLLKVYPSRIIKPKVAVCVPAEITGIENDAVVDAVASVGARRIFLIEEPIAAAIGSGIDVFQPVGQMVIDMGGGTTDVAVISLGGQVRSASIAVAGNTIDDAITRHLRQKFGIVAGKKSVERLKCEIADCMATEERCLSAEIKGHSTRTGLPQRLTVTGLDLLEPVVECVQRIADCAHHVLEVTPPELAGDIYNNDVYITGGTAMLRGLDEYLGLQLKVHVRRSEDPINCVAIGTGRSIELADRLETGFREVTPGFGGKRR